MEIRALYIFLTIIRTLSPVRGKTQSNTFNYVLTTKLLDSMSLSDPFTVNNLDRLRGEGIINYLKHKVPMLKVTKTPKAVNNLNSALKTLMSEHCLLVLIILIQKIGKANTNPELEQYGYQEKWYLNSMAIFPPINQINITFTNFIITVIVRF